jgi:hypothetical protein
MAQLSMVQLSTDISVTGAGLPPRKEPLSNAIAELNALLLRRVELSCDIARIRHLLRFFAQNYDSRGQGGEFPEASSAGSPNSASPRRHPSARSTFRQQRANALDTRPGRSKLERACRIALMETNEPASVETIYDRIQKRGSLTFTGYRRPLRAIALAMNALVKQGEASLSEVAGSRRWQWETERTPLQQPTSHTRV